MAARLPPEQPNFLLGGGGLGTRLSACRGARPYIVAMCIQCRVISIVLLSSGVLLIIVLVLSFPFSFSFFSIKMSSWVCCIIVFDIDFLGYNAESTSIHNASYISIYLNYTQWQFRST